MPSSLNFHLTLQDVLELYSGNEKFALIGYSFGSLLTLEVAKLLESKGKKGSVTFIDGSPQFIHKVANLVVPDGNDESIQAIILLTCSRLLFPDEHNEIVKRVFSHNSWETKLQSFADVAKERSQYSAEYGSKMLTALINRLKISLNADKLSLPSLSSSTVVSLIKPSESSAKGLDEDYGLGKLCSQKISVNIIDGNHASMLSNPELVKLLNN